MLTSLITHARRNAVAFVALLVALSGSAYAAVSLPTNSVGTRQLKNHSVTYAKLNPQAVYGVLSRQVYGSFRGPSTSVCPVGGTCDVGASDARCPQGGLAISGGWTFDTNPPLSATVGVSEPDSDGHGWHVIMGNDDNTSGFDFRAIASCTALSRAARDTASAAHASITQELAATRGARRSVK